jgi:hypothetical protein
MSTSTNTISPLRSPEYLAPLKQNISVGPADSRLCSHDGECGHGDAGCLRNDILIEWEKENPGQYVTGEENWNSADWRSLHFTIDGVTNHYKPSVQYYIDEDIKNIQSDSEDAEFIAFLNSAKEIYSDFNTADQIRSLDDVKSLIADNPSGMPTFIKETDSFYQFEDVGSVQITADNITKEILTLIQTTFTDEWTLSSFDPVVDLYLKDDKVYLTNLSVWHNISNPAFRAGITLVGENFSFYPFAPLDDKTEQLVTLAGTFFAKFQNKTFSIVNL